MDFTRSNHFNSVYVVESLRDGDLKTGNDIYEICVYPEGQLKSGLHTAFFEPKTKKQLMDTLSSIIDECREKQRGPILHIDVHGGSDYIESGNGERILWADLKPYLCELNTISRLNLLVVMAACDGINLAKVLLPTDRAPVWGFIGPQSKVQSGKLLEGFINFYFELFHSWDGRKALNALNNSSDVKKWEFKFFNSEFFFLYVYKNYFETLCTKEPVSMRAKSIFSKISGGHPISSDEERQIIDDLTAILFSSQEFFFDKHKEIFFMIDLFSENNNRFDVSFNRCLSFLRGNGS